MAHPNSGFLTRAHSALVYFGGFYAAVICLFTIPWFQRQAIFMHAVRWPWGARFDIPQNYGFAPGRTINLNLTTLDDVHIGAWLTVSESFYQKAQAAAVHGDIDIHTALSTYPTLLFYHGNAASRAATHRPRVNLLYSTRVAANVLAIDYRGFADSEGEPSEIGVRRDARAAWDWLRSNGAKPEDIILMGQSLGTGVASSLAVTLSDEGNPPRGIVLIAPFTSIPTLLEDYQIFGLIPVFRPLKAFPFVTKILFRFIQTHFDTLNSLPQVQAPVILVHAEDDYDIPHTHSAAIFDHLLESRLSPLPADSSRFGSAALSPEHQEALLRAYTTRRIERAAAVTSLEIPEFASVLSYRRQVAGKDAHEVVFIRTKHGGHNNVLLSEGVVDLIGRQLDLRHCWQD